MYKRYHFQWNVYERGNLSVKNGIYKVRGWSSGRSLPVKKVVEYPNKVQNRSFLKILSIIILPGTQQSPERSF